MYFFVFLCVFVHNCMCILSTWKAQGNLSKAKAWSKAPLNHHAPTLLADTNCDDNNDAEEDDSHEK